MGRFPTLRRVMAVMGVTTTFVAVTAVGPQAAAALPSGAPSPSATTASPSRMPGTPARTAQQDALPLGFRAALTGLALFGLLVSFAAGARGATPRHREQLDRFIE